MNRSEECQAADVNFSPACQDLLAYVGEALQRPHVPRKRRAWRSSSEGFAKRRWRWRRRFLPSKSGDST